MKTYCVKCKKDTENIDRKTVRKKKERLVMQSKCPICEIEKLKIYKRTRRKRFIEYFRN